FGPLLREAGVPIEEIPRPRPSPRQLVGSALALSRVLRRERPHVVHAHNPAAAAAAALARVLARQPEVAIVTTYHGVAPRRCGRGCGRSSSASATWRTTCAAKRRSSASTASST